MADQLTYIQLIGSIYTNKVRSLFHKHIQNYIISQLLSTMLLSRLNRLNIVKKMFFLTQQRVIFGFSNNQTKEKSQTSSKQQQQMVRRQQQIQFRKKILQQKQLQSIRNRIENTKGNFNPTIAYFKLYSAYLPHCIAAFSLIILFALYLKAAGLHKDPFSGKKKIILISDKYEKTIDSYLQQMVYNQLCGSTGIPDQSSNFVQKKSKQIEDFLTKTTGRKRKVIIIPSDQHILLVLPSSLIISKNILLSKASDQANLKPAILVMESLFEKKYHIKDLAISNVLLFTLCKLTPSPVYDLKMTSIYSRTYSKHEIEQTIEQISQHYKMEIKSIEDSVLGLISSSSTQADNENSPFSITKRIEKIL